MTSQMSRLTILAVLRIAIGLQIPVKTLEENSELQTKLPNLLDFVSGADWNLTGDLRDEGNLRPQIEPAVKDAYRLSKRGFVCQRLTEKTLYDSCIDVITEATIFNIKAKYYERDHDIQDLRPQFEKLASRAARLITSGQSLLETTTGHPSARTFWTDQIEGIKEIEARMRELYGFAKLQPAPECDYHGCSYANNTGTKWWIWSLWICGCAVVLIALAVFIWKYCVRRRKEKDLKQNGTVFISAQKVDKTSDFAIRNSSSRSYNSTDSTIAIHQQPQQSPFSNQQLPNQHFSPQISFQSQNNTSGSQLSARPVSFFQTPPQHFHLHQQQQSLQRQTTCGSSSNNSVLNQSQPKPCVPENYQPLTQHPPSQICRQGCRLQRTVTPEGPEGEQTLMVDSSRSAPNDI